MAENFSRRKLLKCRKTEILKTDEDVYGYRKKSQPSENGNQICKIQVTGQVKVSLIKGVIGLS